MATIYPEHQRYHNPDSPAERRMYPCFAALPDSYTVFCNRRWHAPPDRRRPARPAEADFIVAHPDRGALVVEVKGGAIRYEPGSDTWFTNQAELQQSPFAQAERIQYRLRDMLARSPATEVEFPLGHAVALPDLDVPRRALPASVRPELLLDASDLDDLEPGLVRAFEAFGLDEGNGARFGRRGVKALTDAVAGTIDLARPVGRQVEEAEAELLRLTENQYEVLDALDGNPRVCVLGGAGTGKTLLAIEQARRLGAQGLRVLVTCFNNPLAGHIREALRGLDGVEVRSFHGLCRAWGGEAGLDVHQRDDEPDAAFYDERCPALLGQAADQLDRRVEAVIVDEAQDFLPDWLDTLELLLAEDSAAAIVFLFADENQAIYRRQFAVPAGFMTYRLSANLRNTTAIHGLLTRHFDERSRARGPDGIPVQVRPWRSEHELGDEVSRALSAMADHGVAAGAITVLTGRSLARSCLGERSLGRFRLCEKPQRPNDVRIASVHRFKGLESPVVVLCEMEDVHAPARRSVWYTALSRARVGLFVLVRAGNGEEAGCEKVDEVLAAVLAPA